VTPSVAAPGDTNPSDTTAKETNFFPGMERPVPALTLPDLVRTNTQNESIHL